jgi:hypothetical protein
MKNELNSLITTDAQTGITLASQLADRLHSEIAQATQTERPGGMNYLLPVPVPKEIIASILFYAIATANCGWTNHAHSNHLSN